MRIGIDSLASKVLCRRHNSDLSPLDHVGHDFLQALHTIFCAGVSDDEFRHEVFHVDGSKLELWLLKVLCGILASQKRDVPSIWVKTLFEKQMFAEDSGVYLFAEEGRELTWFFNLVRVIIYLTHLV